MNSPSSYFSPLLLVLICATLSAQECEDIGINTTLEIALKYTEQRNAPNSFRGDDVCIGLVATNFRDITGFQMTLGFDPNCIEFLELRTDVSLGEPVMINNIATENGVLGMSWIADLFGGNAITVPDDSTIVEVCFQVVGDPGDCCSLELTEAITTLRTAVFYELPSGEICEQDSISFNLGPDPFGVKVGCENLVVADLEVCNGENGGNVCFTACGGDGPYTYCLTNITLGLPPFDGPIFSAGDQACEFNIPAGDYILEIKEAGTGILSPTVQFTIEPGSELEANFFGIDPQCINSSNGSIQVNNILGGNGPYQINYSTGIKVEINEGESDTLTNLFVGDYSVTIVDDLGCSITQDLSLTGNPIEIVKIEVDSATCLNADDGFIKVVVTGGTPFPDGTYEFNGISMDSLCETSPMNSEDFPFAFIDQDTCFRLTVQDANGCALQPFDLCIPLPLRSRFEFTHDLVPLCDGDGYRSILDMVTDGVFLLTLTGPFGETINVGVIGNKTGYAPPKIPGNAPDNRPTDNFEGLAPGEYRWLIEQLPIAGAESCREEFRFTVGENLLDPIMLSDESIAPDCGENNGDLIVGTSGGIMPFEYFWEDFPGQDTSMIAEVEAGIYPVTVVDNTGCEAMLELDMQQGEYLSVDLIIAQELDCTDPTIVAQITAEITSSEAITDLNINWSTMSNPSLGSGTNIFTTMPDTYIIEISTASGTCMTTDTIVLEDSGAFTYDFDVVHPKSCTNSGTLGSIDTVMILGGSGFYICRWEDEDGQPLPGNPTQCDHTNLAIGLYYVTITDNLTGCIAMDSIELVNDADVAFMVSTIPPDCPGASTGSINIAGIDLSFMWEHDTNVMDGNPGSLSEGEYRVTITDDITGCSKDTIIMLSDPPGVEVDITNITATTCFDGLDGEATVTISFDPNNDTDFGFAWSNPDVDTFGGTTSTVTELGPGENWVLVSATCTSDTFFFNVGQPDPMILLEDTFSASCNGGCDGSPTLVAMGGTSISGDYGFEWGDGFSGANRNDLCAGAYPITIVDDEMCMQTDTVYILEPDTIMVSVEVTGLDCDNSSSGGGITVTPTGGCGDFTYAWSDNVSMDSIATDLPEGTYSISITDDCGCETVVESSVGASDFMATPLIPDPILCAGDRTCIGIATASGGLGTNYTYNVNNTGDGIPIDSCVLQGPGTYNLTVFDSLGNCISLPPVEVPLAPEYSVSFGASEITLELGEENTTLTADIVSSFSIDSIFWSSSPIDETLTCQTILCDQVQVSPVISTLYTVTVIDENGCQITGEVFVDIFTPRRVYRPELFMPSDPINNRFMIMTGKGVDQIVDFSIYDRWGNLVFALPDAAKMHPTSKDDGWDGRIDGKEAEQGVYVYIANVRFVDDKVIQYKGDLTLIR